MLAYSAGDLEAFETLYKRHKGRVLGYLLARLRDHSEAEDVFQAVFAKLHRGRHQYREEIPFLPWLFTIARNALIDHVRRQQAYAKHISTSEEAVHACAAPVADNSPLHASVVELASLNPGQRRALELRFEQGLTFGEIADQMQTSTDNARQIISRAVRRLRSLLGEKERHREKH